MSGEILHITNGDAAASLIRDSGLGGTLLPWRDVLYDGPVPAGHCLETLYDLRADFLARQFDRAPEETRAGMTARDKTLRNAGTFAEIVLWFEHDLYDQLRIMQILDALATDETVHHKLFLICIDRFPGIEPFYGLGQLRPEQMTELWPDREPIETRRFDLAQTVWQAFTAPDPTALNALPETGTAALPFLGAAISRLMAEYPSLDTGLPATERLILDMVADGIADPASLFREHMKREPAPFLGDWSFWWRLAALCEGVAPLLSETTGKPFRLPPRPETDDFADKRFTLTEAGRRVHASEADAVALNGIDRWIGGVHLRTGHADWRHDAATGRIVPK